MLKFTKLLPFFFIIICLIAILSLRNNDVIDVVITTNNCQLSYKGKTIKCDAGRNGASLNKVEGDGKTPTGIFKLREVFYREDKVLNISAKLPIRKIEENHGWCDDSESKDYNKFIYLPSNDCHSSEFLHRIEDDAYDIIVPLGYNDENIIKGKGSAIFLHVFKENNEPTAGCVAIDKNEFLELLKQINSDTRIRIRYEK
jgi:L,D-peptidoglycan transpeptidase YkuD (ErfK/YbiS/YcfS/YnhG family)